MPGEHPTALDAAAYLIALADADEDGDLLSPMKLQKLLYYVQGWSLGTRGKPMFSDAIEAWDHGPVVYSVWKHFQRFGRSGIAAADAPEPQGLTPDDKDLIASVWETYRLHSAASLRQMTHEERPWIEARGSARAGEFCNRQLSHDTMRDFFAALAAA